VDTRTTAQQGEPGHFGVLLHRHRIAAGISQRELAERAGLSTRAISDLERGARRCPYPTTVRRLARALSLRGIERSALLASRETANVSTYAAHRLTPIASPIHSASGRDTGVGIEGTPARRSSVLPNQLSSFVGRERETAAIKRLLQTTRLLTLTGAGGCGKTRLALHVAYELFGDYATEVWFVDLAPLDQPELVVQTVALAVGVGEEPGCPIEAAIIRAIAGRRLLVVLDNCEHLVGACAHLVDVLLQGCPRLVMLVTSREALRVDGERVVRLPPLSTPAPEYVPEPGSLRQYEAIQLFIERAVAVQPSFALTDANASAVAEVCRRLDGIPLAIELAAARAHVLTVEQLASLLNDQLRLLVGGSRTAAPRQQTLRATLAWSHDLLSEAERILFRRLAVFAGGCTLQAIETICSGDGIGAEAVLDIVTGLVDKSLAFVEAHGGEARYRLLETVRHYAAERLEEAGELTAVRTRHRDWYLGMAERALPELTRRDQYVWYERLTTDYDNFRIALAWSQADPDGPEAELRLAAALGRFWHIRGPMGEGRAWLTDALMRASSTPSPARATALNWAGIAALRYGDVVDAARLLGQGVDLARDIGDPRPLTVGLRHLAMVLLLQQQNNAASRPLLEEALATARSADDAREVAFSLCYLGKIAEDDGDLGAAERLYEDALAAGRTSGDAISLSHVLLNLADLARGRRDDTTARSRCRETLKLALDAGDRPLMAAGLVLMGSLERVAGRSELATILFAAEAAWRLRAGVYNQRLFPLSRPRPTEPTRYADDLTAACNALGEDAFLRAQRNGQTMTLEDAASLVLEGNASAEAASGGDRPAACGEEALHIEAHKTTPATHSRRSPGTSVAALTAREQEVAGLVAKGLSNRRIAEALVITESTVVRHVSNILGKLGFGSRAQIAIWVLQRGIVTRAEPRQATLREDLQIRS
jgi:predicted ATPase/DNA-binding CsgD family transcriptional regulator/transcriptional regulator with XRE-family HTH domain